MLAFKQDIKILDFDIENRPLSYWIPDQPTAEVTAIAWCWVNDVLDVQVRLLGRSSLEAMLMDFYNSYCEADMVTGHYIRKHDLPLINGALMELGLPQLPPKLTCDTKLDMVRKLAIPATQEYLSEILDVPMDKVHMTQGMWREANRLTPEGISQTQRRVVGDVVQHIMLRQKMLDAGMLSAPKVWRP